MPYARPEDRIAAKRRYNASPKGRRTRQRYYRERKPADPVQYDPAPLAHAIKEWMQ